MHPFKTEVEKMLTHLKEAYQQISMIVNPDMHLLRNQILSGLKKDIDMLGIQLGIDPDQSLNLNPSASAGPIKKMFGKDITPHKHADPVKQMATAVQTSEDLQDAELKLRVDYLYPVFNGYDNDYILDSLPDVEVRALAKKAGVPVSDDNPKSINAEFIDLIKAGIKLQLDNKAAGLHDFNNPDTNPNAVNEGEVTDTDTTGTRIPAEDLPDENGVTNLQYSNFEEMEFDNIREIYSDEQIRGVAIRAGLPVTATAPAKIDKKFVDQIKKAAKAKAESEADAATKS